MVKVVETEKVYTFTELYWNQLKFLVHNIESMEWNSEDGLHGWCKIVFLWIDFVIWNTN